MTTVKEAGLATIDRLDAATINPATVTGHTHCHRFAAVSFCTARNHRAAVISAT